VNIVKSTRHSKITGDFAEALVLYWLSRDGFECARLDHTGIDLLARNRHSKELMGISVKSRSRYRGTESDSVNLPTDGFKKAAAACEAFGCVPYYAIVVDGGEWIRMFLTSMKHVEKVALRGSRPMRYWGMSERHISAYRTDPEIKSVELAIAQERWWK
jgi:hypothetical protein